MIENYNRNMEDTESTKESLRWDRPLLN